MKVQMDYLEQYIQLFGSADLIPIKWFSSEKFKTVDEVYEKAVKSLKTWREITGWKDDKNSKIAL